MSSGTKSFLNYPAPLKGPEVPYENETQSIPAFRGAPLIISATLIHKIGLAQSYFWRNAGFDVIRKIPELNQYSGRYDPTVIPVEDNVPVERELQPPSCRKRAHRDQHYTSADYHALYLSGELTPLAVVECLLPLVRRDVSPAGKHSTAFLESKVDVIRAAAEASTERYKMGKPLGPLDGVPIAVKDEVHVAGYKRTLGTKLDFKHGSDGTSWCVQQWQDAGAIIIGKTTMHELGLGQNPHNQNYYCGGSSGGSGYAVSAGLVPIALGADGGGSIRIPSSFCGLWGLKTTHGRVSGAPSLSLAPTVGVLGPMAGSIDDLALAYRLMAAPAPVSQDAISSQFPNPKPLPDNHKRAKRLGIVREWIDRAEAPVRAVFDAAVDYYRKQGYEVIEISIPYLPEGQRAHVLTIMAEIAAGVDPSHVGSLSAPNKVLVSIGMWQITANDLLAAQRLRNLLMQHISHLFHEYPGIVLFTPTSPIPGWRIEGGETELAYGLSDGKTSVRNMEYVWLANFMGCPAITCPAGYAGEGNVPIGVMAMGDWGSEEELIEFARDGEGLVDRVIPAGHHSVWEDVLQQARGYNGL
ncbi:hypothetical protein N7539_002881 [Penicillium diatomitis]|uniref:Amidase domain-containing protein n=1 Tax=Penicillium diatomitis TaxID=2819901 RepID=A0A9W9XFM6_9EURO|nr:uncharacterized protein N7539_002881 [Penicillium diatomitis]KAJ5491314.1 hypothetical protein N7539_002881 [Penicillium diatomitis]